MKKVKQKFQIIQQHFGFKDFIGLSALIFGLLLSHTPVKTSQSQPNKTAEVVKPEPKVQAAERKIASPTKSSKKRNN